jgi:hypothetical protein
MANAVSERGVSRNGVPGTEARPPRVVSFTTTDQIIPKVRVDSPKPPAEDNTASIAHDEHTRTEKTNGEVKQTKTPSPWAHKLILCLGRPSISLADDELC